MSGIRTRQARTRQLASAIARRGPPPSDPFPCPYLIGRSAQSIALIPDPLVPGIYHSLMDLNFRRLGRFFYRPCCSGCDACRMIRVATSGFCPSRSQRRCLSRNGDLVATFGHPQLTRERHALYQRYLAARHDHAMDGSVAELRNFLYISPLKTMELVVRWGDQLVAASIVDVEPEAMSAVYTYFDPSLPKRSLGTWCVLAMIDQCRRLGLGWLYLGYYVGACRQMAYKISFHPHAILHADGSWDSSILEEGK